MNFTQAHKYYSSGEATACPSGAPEFTPGF